MSEQNKLPEEEQIEKFTLTDEKVQEISTALREKAADDVH